MNRRFAICIPSLALLAMASAMACSAGSRSVDTTESSGEKPGPVAVKDAGSVTAPSATSTASPTPPSTPPTSTDAGQPLMDQATCLIACNDAHTTGVTLAAGIDSCWNTSCNPSCTLMPDQNGMQNIGEVTTDGGALCKTSVNTPSPTCSDCTVTNCCTAWDACFTNADCMALNACSIACYQKYPNAG